MKFRLDLIDILIEKPVQFDLSLVVRTQLGEIQVLGLDQEIQRVTATDQALALVPFANSVKIYPVQVNLLQDQGSTPQAFQKGLYNHVIADNNSDNSKI